MIVMCTLDVYERRGPIMRFFFRYYKIIIVIIILTVYVINTIQIISEFYAVKLSWHKMKLLYISTKMI
jgi:hypothetical protein